MSTLHSNPTKPSTLVDGLVLLGEAGKLCPGMLLGPYRLVRLLGEGGMGVVWLADQLEPFMRQVAIKLSTQDVSGGLAQAYFEVERQALAQLVHPYIAQIYDAGQLPEIVGQKSATYFAMEFVDGDTLDAYIRRRKLSLADCAELIAKICQGAEYAHQRGLIHRDLKPTNVLIAELAGTPIPKIIDFGIAIGVQSAQSAALGSAGTRAYMAPEQIERGPGGIDLRADVYALGGMLVEALCLSLGISPEAIHRTGFLSLLSHATSNPDKQRPGSIGEAAGVQENAAAQENTRALLTRLPTSLRAIALKAMAHQRDQRYDSAAALAEDLRRWLARKPVLARRGGRLYAITCFVNRYRLASALGVLTLLALVGGLITASYGLQQAKLAQALAETRREQSDALVNYMLGDFAAKLSQVGKLDLIDDVAKQALAYLTQANDTDARSAIQRAAALRTIGDLQTQRGKWTEARSTFLSSEQALDFAEAAEPGTSELLFERAQVAYWIGYCDYTERKLDAAKAHWLRYLNFAQRLQPLTVAQGTGLFETASALNNLGTASFASGDLKAAAGYFDQSIAIKNTLLTKNKSDADLASSIARSLSWQAKTQEASGDLRGAMSSYLNQLALCERYSAAFPSVVRWRYETAVAQQWVGVLKLQMGDLPSAKKQLVAAERELFKLHQLEPSQSTWQDALANTRSTLAWAHLFSADAAAAEQQILGARKVFEMPSNISVMPANWRRGAATAWFRAARIVEAKSQHESAALKMRSIAGFKELLEIDPNDRKSLISLATALAAEATPDTTELRRVQSRLVSLSVSQPDASALDALMRTHIVLREFPEAQTIQSKLNVMGYHHPDYEAFLVQHPGAMP